MTPEYAYPSDLASFVRSRWSQAPDVAVLEGFFSACYQASLLREEERPVVFRAILAEPSRFPETGRPPESLQRFEFSRALPFEPNELRRLSVATDAQRTLIGVRPDATGALEIWGLVNSGNRWLREVQGGRQAATPLPFAPVVHVDAPGSLAAHKGDELLAKLQQGSLSGSRADPFVSAWLPGQFTEFRNELMAQHLRAAERVQEGSGERWAPIEPNLPRRISERMMKRVVAMLRQARHGGTIIFAPAKRPEELCVDCYVDLKYRFESSAPRCSFPGLVVAILNRLAQLHGSRSETDLVTWRDFETSTDGALIALDESLFETAHVIAGLASADGAVALSKQHDLLGFGGMISGDLPDVRMVARALDLEGSRIALEETGNVGARHRSAYRLANALPGAVIVVISQDGGVRFICRKDDYVTYWEQD